LPPGSARLLAEGLEKGRRLPVVWLSFQECTGCTESLTRSSAPSMERLLFEMISLNYHHTLQAAAGEAAKQARRIEVKSIAVKSFPRASRGGRSGSVQRGKTCQAHRS
jgi:hydrogenase small subunit